MDSGVVRFGVPGLLVGLALALGFSGRGPAVWAQSGSKSDTSASTGAVVRPAAGAKAAQARPITAGDVSGTLALLANSPGQAHWLYLIDTKKQAFAVYRIDPSNPKGSVKLEASRQYKWDLELEHYNNQAPEPDAIKATVKTLARSTP
jgi:hypothetical protein